MRQLVYLFRETISLWFLKLSMFFAPQEMELAIAKGICLTFPDLANKIHQEKY